MRSTVILCSFIFSIQLAGQDYQPDWGSLDKRPTPQWFQDAKFGIFIHWGVYSVPAWCTKGNYAEWYQYGLQTNDTTRQNFHKTNYGNSTYYDLAKDFKAELFDPEAWADLFERSGAKYIVLTSKHHDGFTLWPSKEADKTWGFKWNAKDIGPHRDLLGDLFKAVRKTSVHAGMYYSLYEWFNPLWKSDRSKFVTEHTWPQMKDLINTYKPDVFWTDGDWDATAETWKSQEFLAWLYNESPVKDKIVVNDRWGSGIRFHHGGIYTPEYQPDLHFENHYWEESRGMGFSYGYNREEDAWDYNSTQSLVLQLIDKVSRGGNFLLDIGPDAHGKIPPIMQERLLQMGDWMKINGESIYGTRKWKFDCQWSDGSRDYKEKSGDMLLKITLDPDPGYAVKEIFYTYNPSANDLYAIFPKYPVDRKILLREVELPAGTRISFLSTKEVLKWQQTDKGVEISLPEYDPNNIKAPYAYVIKIHDFGNYAAKPAIRVEYKPGELKPIITIEAENPNMISYSIDGTTPMPFSQLYKKPFSISKSATIRAIAFRPSHGPVPPNPPEDLSVLRSAESIAEAKVYEWKNAVNAPGPKQGIKYNYFEPAGKIDMNSFKGKAIGSGIAEDISVRYKKRQDRFAFEFYGYIQAKADGIYTFFTDSDDGSKLYIDDEEIVNNDGDHGNQEVSGVAALKKGFHKIKVLYFDSGGGNSLKVSIRAEGSNKTEIPASLLFH